MQSSGDSSSLPKASGGSLAYRPDIDGMRAVAVLGVVVYHAFPGAAPGGFAGVDVFFVISGFLISEIILGQLAAGRFSFANFYGHRVRRIFPALAIVLVATWVIAWNLLAPGDFMDYARSQLGGVGFYANFTAANEDYFNAMGAQNLLLHLWSLGIEEQFYLFWPLLLFVLWRWKPSVLAPVIGALILASFADDLWRTQTDPVRAFYFPDSRLWELGIGGALAYAVGHHWMPSQRTRIWLSGAGAIAVAASLYFLNGRLAWPGGWALIPTLGTAALLAAGPGPWFNRAVLSSRIMVAIGKVSYPWYLWHWPLLLAGRMIPWNIPQDVVDAAMAVLSLALASATYFAIERPIRFGMKGTLRTVLPIVAMGVPAVLAVFVIAERGDAGRFPPALREILAARDIVRREEHQSGYESCFDKSQTFVPLDPGKCVEGKSGPADRRPLVLVWGDSHAFSLYPGLRALEHERHDFRLGFFGKGSCPFFAVRGVTASAGGCDRFLGEVRREIAVLKPDVLVVDSFWADPQYDVDGAFDGHDVHDALLALKGLAPRIVVVGTVPVWQFPEPTIVAREWRRNGGVIPEFSGDGLNPSTFATEAAVARAVAGTGAVYVPLLPEFCRRGRCRLMADAHNPLQFDGWHLTWAGSDLAAQIIAPVLLGKTPAQ